MPWGKLRQFNCRFQLQCAEDQSSSAKTFHLSEKPAFVWLKMFRMFRKSYRFFFFFFSVVQMMLVLLAFWHGLLKNGFIWNNFTLIYSFKHSLSNSINISTYTRQSTIIFVRLGFWYVWANLNTPTQIWTFQIRTERSLCPMPMPDTHSTFFFHSPSIQSRNTSLEVECGKLGCVLAQHFLHGSGGLSQWVTWSRCTRDPADEVFIRPSGHTWCCANTPHSDILWDTTHTHYKQNWETKPLLGFIATGSLISSAMCIPRWYFGR